MSIEILKKYNIKAKKALGQNFLINTEIVKEISEVIEISGKNIVEVGPGYGALTEKLIEKKPKSLELIELDNDMINILNNREYNGDFDLRGINFSINNIDVLKYFPDFNNYSVIANIPYYITSPILKHFLYDVLNKPEKMLILMQKDVGDKIIKGQLKTEHITKKNKLKTSVLSLFIAKKAYVEEMIFVGKENFIPAPNVESSVLLFNIHDKYNYVDDLEFLEFIKKGFCEPRKKLFNNMLKKGLNKQKLLKSFSVLNFKENLRAEDLTLDNWIKFLEIYKKEN